jgi:hypothetical protein
VAKIPEYVNQFENLPGSNIQIKDGVGGLGSEQAEGKEIVVVGTAVDGPKLEPVNIGDDYDTAEEIFGPYYNADGTNNGSTLTYNAKRLIEGGADNVTLLRLSGETATGEMPLDGYFKTETKKSREFFGDALGNLETTIDLLDEEGIADKPGYRTDGIVVYADGNQLASRFYDVDNTNGVVTIDKDATDSLAPITIEYELVEIVYGRSGYSPQNTTDGNDYASQTFVDGDSVNGNGVEFEVSNEYAKLLMKVVKQDTAGTVIEEYDIVPYGDESTTSLDSNNVYVTSFNSDGTTTIRFEDPVNIGATEELLVEYLYAEPANLEEPTLTSTASERQFETDYDNVVPQSELVFQSVYNDDEGDWKLQLLARTDEFDGTSAENKGTYKIDYESGMITTFEKVDQSASEQLFVAYRYNNNNNEDREITGLNARGQAMSLRLDHNASNESRDEFEHPVALFADGREVSRDAYDVDFDSMYQATVITVYPGYFEQGATLKVVYYWKDEVFIEPTIDLEAANPGKVYNETKLFVEDNFYEQESYLNYNGYGIETQENTVTGETLSTDDDMTFELDNAPIKPGSIAIYEGGSEITSQITSKDLKNGTVTFDETHIGTITADYTWLEKVEVINHAISPEFVEQSNGYYIYEIPSTINIGTDSEPFYAPFGGLSFDIEDLDVVQDDTDETEIDLQNDDIEVNFRSGVIACKVANADNGGPGIKIPKCDFRTTEERVSFVNNKTLERVTRTKFKLGNQNIVKNTDGIGNNPLDLYIERADRDTPEELTRGTGEDYTVDWSSGVVELVSSKALGEKDSLIVRRYAYYNIEGRTITIEKPKLKTGQEESREIEIELGDEVRTIGGLAEEINNNSKNNVVEFKITSDLYTKHVLDIKTPDVKIKGNVYDGTIDRKRITLSGGRDGIDMVKEEMYEKLGGKTNADGEKVEYGAYDVLMDYEPADIVMPVGVYANDELASDYKDFANQLAQFLANCFYNNNELRGIIGLNPLENPTRRNVIDRVNNLSRMQTLYFLQDENGNVVENNNEQSVDVGKFISVVGHDVVINDRKLGMSHIESAAAEYGAVVSMIDINNAPTNEVLPGKLAYTYSRKQANVLSGNRIITYKDDAGVTKIADSPTCAFPGSGWNRYMTVDIVFDTIDLVREIFDKYIGQGNKIEKRNALESEIRQELKELPTLRNFDYNMKMSTQDQFMGRMLIELKLVPVTELREINTVVSINAQM